MTGDPVLKNQVSKEVHLSLGGSENIFIFSIPLSFLKFIWTLTFHVLEMTWRIRNESNLFTFELNLNYVTERKTQRLLNWAKIFSFSLACSKTRAPLVL